MGADSQLSLLEELTVVLRWHPDVSPPDATGPFDHAHEAAVATNPSLRGWGRTEHTAIRALAARLRQLATAGPRAAGLTPVDRALTAAERLNTDALAGWLARRSTELQLAEPRASATAARA